MTWLYRANLLEFTVHSLMESVVTSEGRLQRGRGLVGRLVQAMPTEGKARGQKACWGQVEQSPEGSVLAWGKMAVFTLLWLGGFGKRSPRWKGLVSLQDGGRDGVVWAESWLPTAHW